MDRLDRAISTLHTSKQILESSPVNSKKICYERERMALIDVREVLTQAKVRKERHYNERFADAMQLLFEFMSHRDATLRILSEQAIDSILRRLILELNSSRAAVVLMTEIKRNGAPRSLTGAISRLSDVVKYSKVNRASAIGAHLLSALLTVIRRPEEIVQSSLEKYVPLLFNVLGPQMGSQHAQNASELYCLAVDNLELSGTASRAAAVIIHQLSSYFPRILRKAFKHFSGNLDAADDGEGRARLVGTLNSLRLLWPLIICEDYDTQSLRNVIRNDLRCLFSSRNDVIVASLELLDRVFSSPLSKLLPSTFFLPDPSVVVDDDANSLAATTSRLGFNSECTSSCASPSDSLFDLTSPPVLNLPSVGSDQEGEQCSERKPTEETVLYMFPVSQFEL
ncbi:hypothetical protein AB6A40_008244 [Gnathostoma spinigerum]|uniref:TOG domain-containing protein n=1 Tax=Gnathostoma spinigerum TaxID=75299 RepID=A0ABD6EPS4_9BILA